MSCNVVLAYGPNCWVSDRSDTLTVSLFCEFGFATSSFTLTL